MTSSIDDNSVINRAICFATNAHGNQVRKVTGGPYVMHPIAVARILSDYGLDDCDHSLTVAAVLHDVIEDTEVTAMEIGNEFGSTVVGLVLEVTERNKTLSYFARKSWTIDHIGLISSNGQLLKLADMVDNLRSDRLALKLVGKAFWGHLRGGSLGTFWYHYRMSITLQILSAKWIPNADAHCLIDEHFALIRDVWPDLDDASAEGYVQEQKNLGR